MNYPVIMKCNILQTRQKPIPKQVSDFDDNKEMK